MYFSALKAKCKISSTKITFLGHGRGEGSTAPKNPHNISLLALHGDSHPHLWQLSDLHFSIMPAIEEAQGKADKLQSAPGVNRVREVLELFTVLQKSFKDAPIGEEIVRSSACFAHKTCANTIRKRGVSART